MSKRMIVIESFADGSATVEGFGFKGRECDAELAIFEKALGQVKTKKYKGDIHKQGRVKCVENHA